VVQQTQLDAGNATIELNNGPAGVYMARVQAGNRSVVKKFVKQ